MSVGVRKGSCGKGLVKLPLGMRDPVDTGLRGIAEIYVKVSFGEGRV